MVSHYTEPQLAADQLAYPAWSAGIRQHYWNLRYARAFDSARVRREYRQIAKEKERLYLAGIDAELVRLLCRHLVNLGNKRALRRWWDAFRESGSLCNTRTLSNRLDSASKPAPILDSSGAKVLKSLETVPTSGKTAPESASGVIRGHSAMDGDHPLKPRRYWLSERPNSPVCPKLFHLSVLMGGRHD